MDIFDFIFPKKCLECGEEGKYICPTCLAKVKYVPPIFLKGMDEVVSLWEYDGVIRKAILAFKYKFAKEVGHELSNIITQRLRSKWFKKGAILVPIPLHWYRKNFRGFNQSEEIGKAVAQELKWKFMPDLIERKKSTTPQAELKAEERIKNIKEVFSLNKKYSSFVKNKSFVIFDDVWTTGSTMKETAKILKESGAKKIWGLTIAR